MTELETIFDCEHAKFNVPIEERVNELIEMTKKEYPTMDNYLIWLCAVDFVLEEMGLKKDNENGAKMYEEYVKQRKTFIYNNVSVDDDEATEVAKLNI